MTAHRSVLHRLVGIALLALLVVPVGAGAQDPSPGPAIGLAGDQERTGRMPGHAPRGEVGVNWTARLGGASAFVPQLVDGVLIAGDLAGLATGLDPATGAERWRTQLGSPVTWGAVADGLAVVITRDGRVVSLDPTDGAIRWSRDGDQAGFAPAIADGVVWVGTWDGRLLGLAVDTGKVVASHDVGSLPMNVTVVDGVAYFGTTAAQLHALDLATGEDRWAPVTLLSDAPGYAVVGPGLVYIGALQPPGDPTSELIAVDKATGEVRWRQRFPRGTDIRPTALVGDTLFINGEAGIAADDALTGERRWLTPTALSCAPGIWVDGLVVQVDCNGLVTAVEAADGTVAWTLQLPGWTTAAPIMAGGRVIVAVQDGTIRALGTGTPGATPPPTPAPSPGTALFELVETWDPTTIPGLDQPSGIDVAPDGTILVVNAERQEILRLDADGRLIARFGEEGTGDGQLDFRRDPVDPFASIGGVAAAADGTVFVADTVNDRVQHFSADGTFLGRFGSTGTFLEPFDLVVAPDGTVLVVDDVRDDIQRFTPEGVQLDTIGHHGGDAGGMRFTGQIEVTPDGTILNADFDNNRVQAWDADGDVLWSFGSAGVGDGQFDRPVDVVVDDAWRILVVDQTRLQVFDADRRFLGSWTPPDGEVPTAVMVLSDGDVLVASAFVDRIHRLRPIGPGARAAPSG